MKCKYDCFSCPYEDCINDSKPTAKEKAIIGDQEETKTTAAKKEYMRNYYQEHKEKCLEYQRAYRAKHRERLNKYRNEYYYKHQAEEQERQRQYYQDHREQELERVKEYDRRKREKVS